MYAGSAVGAVLAGDLVTLFVFWELLAVTSVFQIWAAKTPASIRAGLRYLIVHVTSGMLLLAGAAFHFRQTGGLAFEHMELAGPASWLLFFAFGIQCAFPFLHNWLVDSYPEATPTGTVFLSSFTTKAAVYALARGFEGTEELIWIGAAMTMFPIFFAVIENDLRRVLGYSMINQIGFMVAGVGLGEGMGTNGAVAHAFNDVLFKGLLFMSMGAVLFRTGRIKGSELGGLYKSMPWTAGFCIVGASSISAFPLFSGFVSKSMVMAEAAHRGHVAVWLMLLFASAGVFHHAGIKIPFFAFYSHDAGLRPKEAPWNMLTAMGIGAALSIGIGCFPAYLYALLPYEVDYQPYTATHVVAQVQLLFYSALAFTGLKLTGIYPPELRSTNLDADWVYRRLAPRAGLAAVGVVWRGWEGILGAARRGLERGFDAVRGLHGGGALFARTWTTGQIAFFATVMLGAFLVLYFFG
jgi:multicomponent Na+:H+ antiporter subunit D